MSKPAIHIDATDPNYIQFYLGPGQVAIVQQGEYQVIVKNFLPGKQSTMLPNNGVVKSDITFGEAIQHTKDMINAWWDACFVDYLESKQSVDDAREQQEETIEKMRAERKFRKLDYGV